jgi:hypothetical protein
VQRQHSSVPEAEAQPLRADRSGEEDASVDDELEDDGHGDAANQPAQLWQRARCVVPELLAAGGGGHDDHDQCECHHERHACAHKEEGRERHAGDLVPDEKVGLLLAERAAVEEVLADAHVEQPLAVEHEDVPPRAQQNEGLD